MTAARFFSRAADNERKREMNDKTKRMTKAMRIEPASSVVTSIEALETNNDMTIERPTVEEEQAIRIKRAWDAFADALSGLTDLDELIWARQIGDTTSHLLLRITAADADYETITGPPDDENPWEPMLYVMRIKRKICPRIGPRITLGDGVEERINDSIANQLLRSYGYITATGGRTTTRLRANKPR